MNKLAAKVVSLIGGTMVYLRHGATADAAPVFGTDPVIPAAKAQGIPTLKMPTARGWAKGEVPVAAPGLKVNAFATGLRHPRWMHVLDNGDVLVAEAASEAGGINSLRDYAMQVTMRRAGALEESANRISLLRDRNGDGVAEERHDYLEGLNQPFGMLRLGDTFYVANTDGLVAFDFVEGATRLQGPGRPIVGFKPAGHWTRSILPNEDGTKLYVGVGSLSNIADQGFEVEEGRACIWEVDVATGTARIFAGGLRNPVGMAWGPHGDLWTVVNERDGLGDETPPDYLTSVKEGGFYGWPYAYWGIVDDRVKQDAALAASSIKPDFALGGHTASLGLCWIDEGVLPGFGAGMVIGQHGSWNRSKLSGYKVIHVPFKDGKPVGPQRDILSGFLSDDEKFSRGRPVGVTIGPDGSLLVADDVGHCIWRVTGA